MIILEDFNDASFGGEMPGQYGESRDDLLCRVNKLLALFGKSTGHPHNTRLSCGYRSQVWDIGKGRSGKSAHCVGQALDIIDDGTLSGWILANSDVLDACNLWMEDPQYTKGWCHLGTRATKSGKRIFIP